MVDRALVAPWSVGIPVWNPFFAARAICAHAHPLEEKALRRLCHHFLTPMRHAVRCHFFLTSNSNLLECTFPSPTAVPVSYMIRLGYETCSGSLSHRCTRHPIVRSTFPRIVLLLISSRLEFPVHPDGMMTRSSLSRTLNGSGCACHDILACIYSN